MTQTQANIGCIRLTRKIGERIMIQTSDGLVIVELDEVRGHSARLSIHAPKSIGVDREEIYEKKMANGELRRVG